MFQISFIFKYSFFKLIEVVRICTYLCRIEYKFVYFNYIFNLYLYIDFIINSLSKKTWQQFFIIFWTVITRQKMCHRHLEPVECITILRIIDSWLILVTQACKSKLYFLQEIIKLLIQLVFFDKFFYEWKLYLWKIRKCIQFCIDSYISVQF